MGELTRVTSGTDVCSTLVAGFPVLFLGWAKGPVKEGWRGGGLDAPGLRRRGQRARSLASLASFGASAGEPRLLDCSVDRQRSRALPISRCQNVIEKRMTRRTGGSVGDGG